MSDTRQIAEEVARITMSGFPWTANELINAIDKALRDRDERAAKIAESHFVNHKGDPANGNLIHEGQCHQSIASAIRGES